MCGIAGYLPVQLGAAPAVEAIVERMAAAIDHRGPDDFGTWVDPLGRCAFGHRRLSIVDLSPAGHQPMTSAHGAFVMAFNGEIYNHLDLRKELHAAGGAPHWKGHSDTETLLAGFEHWGIAATLSRSVGMFAIALWEVHTGTLHLARDRLGEKPLYYGWVGAAGNSAFAFGSELKALKTIDGFANPVCKQALAQYMRFLYVPAPRSIFKNIFKLEPGCLLTLTGAPPSSAPVLPLRPPATHGSLSIQRWWSLATVVQEGARTQIHNEPEALKMLETSLNQAVRQQSLADVPLGAFLSGGVDSSTIVALMQQQATRPVKTFTVGFEEAGFDESVHARAVAKHLGTDHTELFVTAVEAQAVIPALPQMYDEPFADSSQIPTHLVCRAARGHVTVALSGDAGDELFGGYNRYFWGPRIWSRVAWLPPNVRRLLGAAIAAVPPEGWNSLSRPANLLLPKGRQLTRAGDKAHKLAARLRGVRSIDDLYLSLVSEWQDPAQVVRGEPGAALREPQSLLDDPLPTTGADADHLRMMYRDSLTYLPDDILCKVDRAAMAVSLETRVPFLDHNVVELAWRLPSKMKIRDGRGKWALRQVLYKHVPPSMIDRPKAGFAIPIGQWLIGPLRPWAESLLGEQRLRQEGYFHTEPIRQKWREHLSGSHDHTGSLWTVLMFQAWLESVN